jgi:hypothetical protein
MTIHNQKSRTDGQNSCFALVCYTLWDPVTRVSVSPRVLWPFLTKVKDGKFHVHADLVKNYKLEKCHIAPSVWSDVKANVNNTRKWIARGIEVHELCLASNLRTLRVAILTENTNTAVTTNKSKIYYIWQRKWISKITEPEKPAPPSEKLSLGLSEINHESSWEIPHGVSANGTKDFSNKIEIRWY